MTRRSSWVARVAGVLVWLALGAAPLMAQDLPGAPDPVPQAPDPVPAAPSRPAPSRPAPARPAPPRPAPAPSRPAPAPTPVTPAPSAQTPVAPSGPTPEEIQRQRAREAAAARARQRAARIARQREIRRQKAQRAAAARRAAIAGARNTSRAMRETGGLAEQVAAAAGNAPVPVLATEGDSSNGNGGLISLGLLLVALMTGLLAAATSLGRRASMGALARVAHHRLELAAVSASCVLMALFILGLR